MAIFFVTENRLETVHIYFQAFHRKDFQMAIDAYTQAIAFDTTDHTLFSNRSLCWLRLGQAEHALSDAKACRELKPDWPKGFFREGTALRLLQRLDEAANAFYEGVLLSPESKELVDAFREAVDAGRQFHGKDKIKAKSNSTGFLEGLVLRNNSLSGILPDDIFVNATSLRVLDVSHNQLEGKLPRSLIHFKAMEFLNVESNRIKDEFPSWLGSMPWLFVLLLRSNQFYGPLYHPHISNWFERLRVIDISHNDFTGILPPFYFSNWSEMTFPTLTGGDEGFGIDSQYMDYDFHLNYSLYKNSMEMVNKGVEMEFERININYRAIDFSGNRLCGNIPESIGLLKGLYLLNLSGNAFTGNIPQSLGNLTKLESLDLSRNQLSGQIPGDLGKLSSLSTMNFSYNNLEGPIPRSTQFQSQQCSSFIGNPKLYGLEEICVKTHVLSPTPQQSEELSEPEEQVINWIAAAIAYGPGVFCGLVIGHIFFASHGYEWFMEKFGRIKRRTAIRSTH